MGHDHDHDHANCDHDHDHDHDQHGSGPSLTAVVEDLGPCKKLLKVAVPSEEVKKEIATRLQHVRKSAHLKGFRPGKAPMNRIEKLYGPTVRDDARDHLLRQGYMKALEEQLGVRKLLGEGTIENVDFNPEEGLKFEVTLHTRPEFEMPQYKGVEIKVGTLEVTDAELEKAIDQFRRTRGEIKGVEAADAVVEGEDRLTVDVQVWLSDEYEAYTASQGGESEGEATEVKPLKEEFGLKVALPFDRLGTYRVEDLADSLTGLKVDEWGECETELGPDFEVVEGRNEPAVLRIQVKGIERLVLPELTEDWVKGAGFDSIDHLKSEIREDLLQQKDHFRSRQVEEAILTKLREDAGQFDLPDELLEKEIQQAERRRVFELRIQQGKEENEAENIVADERDEIRSGVETMLRNFFIMDEITQREEITVSPMDVDARITLMAQARGQDPRTLKEELEKHQVLGQIRHELIDEKTRTWLRENANLVESEDL